MSAIDRIMKKIWRVKGHAIGSDVYAKYRDALEYGIGQFQKEYDNMSTQLTEAQATIAEWREKHSRLTNIKCFNTCQMKECANKKIQTKLTAQQKLIAELRDALVADKSALQYYREQLSRIGEDYRGLSIPCSMYDEIDEAVNKTDKAIAEIDKEKV